MDFFFYETRSKKYSQAHKMDLYYILPNPKTNPKSSKKDKKRTYDYSGRGRTGLTNTHQQLFSSLLTAPLGRRSFFRSENFFRAFNAAVLSGCVLMLVDSSKRSQGFGCHK